MFRMMAIVVAAASLAGTINLATARDNCGSGWYWNGNRCVPSRAEQRAHDEGRFDRSDRYRDSRDRDRYTTGFSDRRDSCRDGYRRIDGRCTWVSRDRF